MKNNTKMLVLSALFTALACIATMIIKIPIPGGIGYIHPGDVVVILSGIILGPVHGFFAAGIGSALADLLSGYSIYAPVTFAVKGLVALCVAHVYRLMIRRFKKLTILVCTLINVAFVVCGYFGFEAVIYQVPVALVGIPANFVQTGCGMVLTFVLYPAITAIPEIKQMLYRKYHQSTGCDR